jgi:hypothetical protein
MDASKIEKQTFNEAMGALKKKQYTQARGLFQQVVNLKVPDSTLAPQAQSQLTDLEQTIKAQEEFDAAERAANKNDLDGAIAQFDKIANGGGPFASRAKTRASDLQKMKAEATANAAVKQEFDAAAQAENNNDLNGALDKFKAVAAKGGTFGAEATKRIQAINDKLAAANADRDWKAALAAENSDPNNALTQFKAIAAKPGNPGNYKDQALTHIQQITEKQNAAADQDKFNDALKKEKSGDVPSLQAALTEFKALSLKPGSMQSQSMDHVISVSQAIEIAKNPHPQQEPKPREEVKQPAGGARSGAVTLIPSGDYDPFTGPVSKGMMVPDNSVEGGLKPIGSLTVPPIDAPAKAYVTFIINIDPNGNVTPGRKTSDDNGLGPQVMPAAKAWKFNPPMVKGKQVQTTIQVKVTF